MPGSWDRGRMARAAALITLVGLLVPYLLADAPLVARAASYAVSDFDVSTRGSAEIHPRISNRVVVWQDYRNNAGATPGDQANADIRMKNLDSGDEKRVNEHQSVAKNPDIGGDIVVWSEMSSNRGLDIQGYNIAKDDHFSVENASGDQDYPAVSSGVVVYQQRKTDTSNWILRGYNIDQDHHFDVSTGDSNHTAPAINGNLVAWVDDRDGEGKTDIFGYDLASNAEFRITDTHDAREPAVSGSFVVFAKGSTSHTGIYVYNRDDGSTRQISSTTQNHRGTPRISGTIVVWEDERNGSGKQDVWGYDLATSQEFPVVTGGDDQYDPDVDGQTIVWTDESHNQDIRGGDLTIGGLATATPTATGIPQATVTPGPSTTPHDIRYFPATGFRIDNDTIWDYFLHRGRRDTFGLPVSRTFRFQGFVTQFFQREIVQIGPDGGARLMNLLDPGLMPVNQINGSTFPAFDPSVAGAAPSPNSPTYSTDVIEFVRRHAPETVSGQPVRFWTTFNNIVTCQDAYPEGGCQQNLLPLLNLEIAGIPTSNPMVDPHNGNFIYLRFQRGIMHYDANCQCTQGILLADWFKSVITGDNLPPDLDAEMQASPFYRQYNNARPLGLNRPQVLPGTDMTNAFEKQ